MSTAAIGKLNSDRVRLPRIGHRVGKYEPMSLNSSPRSLFSRASSIGDVSVKNLGLDSSGFNRPAMKVDDGTFFRSSKKLADNSLSSSDFKVVPDHVQAVFTGDPNKVSIPVFGWWCLLFLVFFFVFSPYLYNRFGLPVWLLSYFFV